MTHSRPNAPFSEGGLPARAKALDCAGPRTSTDTTMGDHMSSKANTNIGDRADPAAIVQAAAGTAAGPPTELTVAPFGSPAEARLNGPDAGRLRLGVAGRLP